MDKIHRHTEDPNREHKTNLPETCQNENITRQQARQHGKEVNGSNHTSRDARAAASQFLEAGASQGTKAVNTMDESSGNSIQAVNPRKNQIKKCV